MTTKPKTLKAPAAKAVSPKPATKEEAGEPKREISEIHRLVSRWRWLAADMAYKAATAPTDKESDASFRIHEREQKEIETKLATLVPQSFSDACCLLEFATDMAEEGGRDDLEIAMLRNAREGLFVARRKDMEAEHAKAFDEAHDDILWTFNTCDKINTDRRKEKLAKLAAA